MNDQIVRRNLDLVSAVTQFILDHPAILDRLPPDFRLVVLPDDDRELSQYNLDLLSKQHDPDKPIVIARVGMQLDWRKAPPKMFVPVTT